MDSEAVVLFDGVCNLCSGAVQFIIRHDPEGYFQFAPLQSEAGRSLLIRHNLANHGTDSIVLIEGERVYIESDAVLRIAKHLSGPWPLFQALGILPKVARDAAYRYLAENRYRWFGKWEQCMEPTPELRGRFLDMV